MKAFLHTIKSIERGIKRPKVILISIYTNVYVNKTRALKSKSDIHASMILN